MESSRRAIDPSTRWRALLLLFGIEERSPEEIASELGVTPRTIYSWKRLHGGLELSAAEQITINSWDKEIQRLKSENDQMREKLTDLTPIRH